ncbi:hypothetical protein VYU27_005045 [Nannochloropsis oceanica]
MPLSRRLLIAITVGLIGTVFLVHRPHNSFHDFLGHQHRGLRSVGPARCSVEVTPEPVKVRLPESNMQLAPAEVDFVIGEAQHMDHQISGVLPGGTLSGPV